MKLLGSMMFPKRVATLTLWTGLIQGKKLQSRGSSPFEQRSSKVVDPFQDYLAEIETIMRAAADLDDNDH